MSDAPQPKRPSQQPQRPAAPPNPPIKPDSVVIHVHRIEIIDNENRVVDMKWLYDLPRIGRQSGAYQAAVLCLLILILFAQFLRR